eukprot:7384905-Prymnesium_polylepis.1
MALRRPLTRARLLAASAATALGGAAACQPSAGGNDASAASVRRNLSLPTVRCPLAAAPNTLRLCRPAGLPGLQEGCGNTNFGVSRHEEGLGGQGGGPRPDQHDARAQPGRETALDAHRARTTRAPSRIAPHAPRLSRGRAVQEPADDQAGDLDKARVDSTIPNGKGGTWQYPSPQMFYNALRRKGKSAEGQEGTMDAVVAIHNNMNELTWKQVR